MKGCFFLAYIASVGVVAWAARAPATGATAQKVDAVPVCFEGGSCYDLTNYTSSARTRESFTSSCQDPNSPFNSTPTHAKKSLCEMVNGKWNWELGEGYEIQTIPGLVATYGTDLEASTLQAFKSFHGVWLPDKLGPDGTGTLPLEWRVPLLLCASANNVLRDLPPAQKELLWYLPFNYAPQAPDNLDPNFPDSIIMFHGGDWELPSCSAPTASLSTVHGPTGTAEFVNTAITSFAIKMTHAATYAGDEGTMWVWLTETSGNIPFTGEWEFRLMPGARMKQLACDVYAPPAPPYKIGDNSVRSVSFAYETTRLGELPAKKEEALLSKLRRSFYNNTLQ